MAKGYYENLYNDMFKGKKGKSSKIKSNSEKLKTNLKKIDNLNTRLKHSGVDVDKATDKRNAVEKFLGLPDDQNILFDALELLGRPQQALFGAIDAAQTGEDAGKAAWEGFKGDKDTEFKDILLNSGMSDRKGKLDLVDVAGFAGDVLLDPADLALFPVAGGAKALKAADKAGDAAKIARKSLSDLAFEGVGKGIKKTAKVSDNLIEKGLKHLDEVKGVKNLDGTITKLKYLTPEATAAANLGKRAITEAGEEIGTKAIGKFEIYKDIKDTFNKKFNSLKSIPKNVKDLIRKNDANSVRLAEELTPLYNGLKNNIDDYAKKVAKTMGDESEENIAKIAKDVDKDLNLLKEYKNLNRKTSMANIIKEAKNGKLTEMDAGPKIMEKLRSIADDVNKADKGLNLTVDIEDGMVKLGDDWKKVNPNKRTLEKLKKKYGENYANDVAGVTLDNKKLSAVLKKHGNYTEADDLKIKELIKKYKKDADFKDLYDKSDNIFNEANQKVNEIFQTTLKTGEDNLGYVRHAFNKEQFDSYKNAGFLPKNANIKTVGNTAVLDDRLYNMSVREANNMWKKQISVNSDKLKPEELETLQKFLDGDGIFKEGLLTSFGDYLNNIPKEARQTRKLDEVLVKTTFSDYDELKKINESMKKAHKNNDLGALSDLRNKKTQILNNSNIKLLSKSDTSIPKGFRQMTTDEMKTIKIKLDKLGTEFEIPELKNLSKSIMSKGQKVAINEDLLRLIEVNTNTSDVKGFTRMYDKFMNFFKRNKVLSPTFQMNNLVGNASNMYLAGISPTKQAIRFPQANSLISKLNKGIPLNEKEAGIWKAFTEAGFGDPKGLMALDLSDMPDGLKAYFKGDKQLKTAKDFLVDGLPYLNNKMNNYMDTLARLSTFIEGLENPKFLQKLGVDDAGEAVRKVLFDPKDLTNFENTTMKRLMPFYTFTKKNLAFQVSNLSKNGGQYHKLFKAQKNLLNNATDGNSENVADWLKENFYIPIPGLDKDGNYTVLRASLPLGSLVETVSNPLDTLVGALSPMAKMPIELATNKNSFTGNEIEKFAGEKSKNIPFLTKKQEHILGGTTGLDVPLKNVSRLIQGFGQGDNIYDRIGNGLKAPVTMKQNIETDKLYKSYDDLKKLEDLKKQYEQKGYEFSNINEIKAANSNALVDNIMARLNKLKGVK